jgi:hypothetical protein
MIEPSEALSTAAQVAVALAGFSGVVVVFSSRAIHEWSRVDKFRLRLMLTSSTQSLALCMLGLLLLATELPQPSVWQWCSGITIALGAPAAVASLRAFASFVPGELQAAGASKYIFYPVSAAGIATSLLQVYNITTLHAFWPFFAAIVAAILASTLQFARMILLRPGSN